LETGHWKSEGLSLRVYKDGSPGKVEMAPDFTCWCPAVGFEAEEADPTWPSEDLEFHLCMTGTP
jgi:hypothetical protein